MFLLISYHTIILATSTAIHLAQWNSSLSFSVFQSMKYLLFEDIIWKFRISGRLLLELQIFIGSLKLAVCGLLFQPNIPWIIFHQCLAWWLCCRTNHIIVNMRNYWIKHLILWTTWVYFFWKKVKHEMLDDIGFVSRKYLLSICYNNHPVTQLELY